MLVIETGVGIRGANTYLDVTYVTNYLTVRNRQSEWAAADPEVREAAVVAATDYVDKRFYGRWRGIPQHEFQSIQARSTVTFTGLPDPGDTILLGGDETYIFAVSVDEEPWQVLIGATPEETAENFANAVGAANGAGVQWGRATPRSRHSTATSAGAVATLTATAPGASGSLSVLEASSANIIISGFSGGQDGGLQPLAWPRAAAMDDRGNRILGIPDRLKSAVSEYSIRAIDGELLPDPTTDGFGARINRRKEKVGPIEEEFRYDLGSFGSVVFVPFPAADRLLRPLLLGSGGGVIRA